MHRLILMRHAKSDWSAPFTADHDRPLNKRGRTAAVALGDWLRDKGYAPGEVLCSSAVRTGDTLRGLRLDPAPNTTFTRKLYHAEETQMLEVLGQAQATTVLMVGHNPGICAFAHLLVEDPPDHDRFGDYPTGATLICDFDISRWSDLHWHQGQVVDFITPRDLIG